MKTLTTEAELDAFCTMAQMHPFVTIDTEFLRERTYYSKTVPVANRCAGHLCG